MARDDARVRHHDEAACRDDARVERWYRDHHARLRAFCSRQLGDVAAADDVAQETLMRAWANRDLFAPDADIAPWLFRVARNLCTDVLRARSRFVHGVNVPDREDDALDPAEPIERAETGAIVRTALASLTTRHREALLLRDVEGVAYPDLAARMGVSEDTARAVLFRARRGLRKRFMEVARATAMLALWPVLRLRARRGSGPFEPALSAAAHAAVGAAAAAALLLLPGVSASPPSPDAAPSPSMSVLRDAATVVPLPDESPSGPVDQADGDSPALRSVAGAALPKASVSASRDGEIHARARTRNPTTGEDAEIWADVWREAGDRESVVLGQLDQLNRTTCAGAGEACAAADEILSHVEGP